jgi:hypothetical protein
MVFLFVTIADKENSKKDSRRERNSFANRIHEHGDSNFLYHIIFDFTTEVLNCSRGYDYVAIFED